MLKQLASVGIKLVADFGIWHFESMPASTRYNKIVELSLGLVSVSVYHCMSVMLIYTRSNSKVLAMVIMCYLFNFI